MAGGHVADQPLDAVHDAARSERNFPGGCKVKWERCGTYSTNGRLFAVRVTVGVTELVYDEQHIPASSKDIRPEHRGEIIAVMRGLAEQIHEEGKR
jgi:hypothetical protein